MENVKESEKSFEELLINCVREYEHLWTISSLKHRDLQRGDNSWAEIAETLNESVEKCKIRWRSLRHTFKKKLSEESKPSGAAGGKKRPWQWMEAMDFLRDQMRKRNTTTNMDDHIQVATCSSEESSPATEHQPRTRPTWPHQIHQWQKRGGWKRV